jgi:hypothetical protein
MNRQTTSPSPSHPLMDQFGARVADRLDAGAQILGHDVAERLRAARTQALAHRRTAEAAPTIQRVTSGSTAVLGGGFGFWGQAASWLPLVALTLGLLGIGSLQDQLRALEIAEVDVELLTSELPTTAYTDPGFAQYLQLGAQD